MDFLKQNKTTLGIGAAAVVVIFIYFMYFSGGSSGAVLSTEGATPVSRDLLVQLQNLHTIKLDTTIFQNPAFLSLTDFGVQIPPENVGRRNPFAAVGI